MWVVAGSDSLGGCFPDPKYMVLNLPPASLAWLTVILLKIDLHGRLDHGKKRRDEADEAEQT